MRASLLLSGLALAATLSAAVLPDSIGAYRKGESKAPVLSDQAVWDEYGLKDAETASYTNTGKTLTVTAYRLQDATGAMAAFEWQRPANGKPGDPELAELTKLAVRTPTGDVMALGNYLLVLDGYHVTLDELTTLFRQLPRQQTGPLPTLPDYLPTTALLPNSGRYITGPASLLQFEPEMQPSTAAFHLGTEAQIAVYKTPAGDMKLAIFSFPTPEMARNQAALIEKLPGAMVKRTGPLVATIFSPKDPNSAERLLAQVRYQAVVSTGDKPPTKKDNWGNFLSNLFVLIGILIVFCLLSGVLFGGMFALFRRGGANGDGETVTTLHLSDR